MSWAVGTRMSWAVGARVLGRGPVFRLSPLGFPCISLERRPGVKSAVLYRVLPPQTRGGTSLRTSPLVLLPDSAPKASICSEPPACSGVALRRYCPSVTCSLQTEAGARGGVRTGDCRETPSPCPPTPGTVARPLLNLCRRPSWLRHGPDAQSPCSFPEVTPAVPGSICLLEQPC